MELIGLLLYLVLVAGLYGLGRNWFRAWRLARENRRRTEESIAENGRVEDREVMRIVRMKKGESVEL